MTNNITNPPANPPSANLPAPGARPWLIAAWPGMGNVGVLAAGTIINQQGLTPITEVAAEGMFDPQGVIIRKGVIVPPRQPRNIFYGAGKVEHSHPLIAFVSEAQPTQDHAAFAAAVAEHAVQMGVERVITFASMATQMHPTQEPRSPSSPGSTSTASRDFFVDHHPAVFFQHADGDDANDHAASPVDAIGGNTCGGCVMSSTGDSPIPSCANQRSASSAAMQPVPAEVIAWR